MDPFIGEIRMFAGNFAPRGWAFCDGQILPIAQYAAVFSLLGTTYGGDGRVTFALPDLRGRAPQAMGAGPGLTPRTLGEVGGVESVTLLEREMPAHGHALAASRAPAVGRTPAGLTAEPEVDVADTPAGAGAALVPGAQLGPTGGGAPHPNLPPSLAINFIIALQGIFPARG